MLKEWLKSVDKRPLQQRMQMGLIDNLNLTAVPPPREQEPEPMTRKEEQSASMPNDTTVIDKKPEPALTPLDAVIAASKATAVMSDADYEAAKAQRDHAVALRQSLLGIEMASAGAINDAIQRFGLLLKHYEFRRAGLPYMPMSLDGLKWRHANGNPKLAIFSLESDTFAITTPGRRGRIVVNDGTQYYISDRFIHPDLPHELESCYADVAKSLRQLGEKRQKTITISAKFTGVIPPEIKDVIRTAKPQFDQLFIIAEPDGFDVKETAIIPEGDPLLVGWLKDPASLWLLADFDTTPVEEAMMLHR